VVLYIFLRNMLLLYVIMCSDIIDDINTIYIDDKHTNKL